MSKEVKLGQKDVLPYLKVGIALLALGIGGEIATSFVHPSLHILTLAAGSITGWDTALYFFGVNLQQNNP